MKINNNNYIKYQSFKAATVNINAFSDTHGELSLANSALEEMKKHQDEIFISEKRGNRNVMAICGDWFMDGGKTGYKTNPEKHLGYFQGEMLNEFIGEVKKLAKDTITLFTLGNHEFDGGVPLLDKVLSQLNLKIVATNMNIAKSEGLAKTKEKNKLIEQYILNVDDDKNSEIKHQVLFLGISPVNLLFYQKNLSGIKMSNNMLKPQAKVKKEDYGKTLEECKQRINKFKESNPNGIVVLMSHTGVDFADNLAKEAKVDIVFDGHEHKDKMRVSNGTPIVPLSMNFKKIVNAKLMIDDNGKLNNIQIKEIYPDKNNMTGVLAEIHKNMFKKDMNEIYTIQSSGGKINTLGLENIREGNNHLANFVTDSILDELRQKDKDIDFFALNASAIRHPLKIGDKPCISPFDVMNVLVGIKEEDGKIMTTELNGEDIVYIVLDNILFNKEMPKKNPIIHYSGLNIDKTEMIKAYENGDDITELAKYIKDARTNKAIDITAEYKIANVEKYFNKSQNPQIKALKHISVYTGDTVQDLFKKHFENSNGFLYAKYDERIK